MTKEGQLALKDHFNYLYACYCFHSVAYWRGHLFHFGRCV